VLAVLSAILGFLVSQESVGIVAGIAIVIISLIVTRKMDKYRKWSSEYIKQLVEKHIFQHLQKTEHEMTDIDAPVNEVLNAIRIVAQTQINSVLGAPNE
jgi:hypothetical protein